MNKMKLINYKIFGFQLIIFLFVNSKIQAQEVVVFASKYQSLGSFWASTFEGGVTLPFSDFNKPAIGYIAKGGIEYYFPSTKIITIGLRLNGYYGELNGESNSGRIVGDKTLRRTIKRFNTPFSMLEPSLVLAAGKGLIISYLSFGISCFFSFIPLETNSYSIYTYSNRGLTTALAGEFGIRFFFHNNFSYNLAVKYFKANSDEFDGFVSKGNDSFATISTGISVHLFRRERIK